MSSALFREEVLTARKNKWLGSILLTQSIPTLTLTLAAITCALVVVLFLIFGEYTQRTRVVGQLQPSKGLSTLSVSTPGELQELYVEEGQTVKTGEVLALVRSGSFTSNAQSSRDAVLENFAARKQMIKAGFRSQLAQLQTQTDSSRNQAANLSAEIRETEQQIVIRQAQKFNAEESLQKLTELHSKKYVTDLQLKQQQNAVFDQDAEIQALLRQELLLQRSKQQLKQALADAPNQKALLWANQQRELSALQQLNLEADVSGQSALVAPVNGLVSAQLVQQGQSVQPGQVVLTILPANSPLQAHLLVPSRAIGFVDHGDAVQLRYQAFPYQKFGHYQGKVLRISRTALGNAELNSLGVAQPQEPMYRVVVELDQQFVKAYGKAEALRPGLLLEADILGDQRKLWEWLLEPLYSVSGKLE